MEPTTNRFTITFKKKMEGGEERERVLGYALNVSLENSNFNGQKQSVRRPIERDKHRVREGRFGCD